MSSKCKARVMPSILQRQPSPILLLHPVGCQQDYAGTAAGVCLLCEVPASCNALLVCCCCCRLVIAEHVSLLVDILLATRKWRVSSELPRQHLISIQACAIRRSEQVCTWTTILWPIDQCAATNIYKIAYITTGPSVRMLQLWLLAVGPAVIAPATCAMSGTCLIII
jgi:hypothetical protein